MTRQAIVATCVCPDGMPYECVLGAPMVRKGDAEWTAKNMKETVRNYADCRNLVFVTTDGAAVYTGKYNCMVELCKNDADFSKLNGLPDFCQKN